MKIVVGESISPLSKREAEVLVHVASGESRKQVAEALHRSFSTINTHLNHILQKLDAKDKAHAVAKGIHKQIITFDKALLICLIVSSGVLGVLPDSAYAKTDITPPVAPVTPENGGDFIRTRRVRGRGVRLVRARLSVSSRGSGMRE